MYYCEDCASSRRDQIDDRKSLKTKEKEDAGDVEWKQDEKQDSLNSRFFPDTAWEECLFNEDTSRIGLSASCFLRYNFTRASVLLKLNEYKRHAPTM